MRRGSWTGACLLGLLGGALGCGGEPVERLDARRGPLGELLDVDGRWAIEGLTSPVDLVRDGWGRLHVWARSDADAARAAGYAVAHDRPGQLLLVRALATGRMAALYGDEDASWLTADIAMRYLGLVAAAQAELGAADPETVGWLDAHADGISQRFAAIRRAEVPVPASAGGVPPEAFTTWTAGDSLAVARFYDWLATPGAESEVGLQLELTRLQQRFVASDTEAGIARRAGLARDLVRFAPLGTGIVGELAERNGWGPFGAAGSEPSSAAPPVGLDAGQVLAAADAAAPALQALGRVRALLAPGGIAGTAWLVPPELTASGNAVLAADLHAALRAPAALWPLGIHVVHTLDRPQPDDLHAAGFAWPGVPALVVGHNQHVAWAPAPSPLDLSDVYLETVTEGGDGVQFEGAQVPWDEHEETVDVRGSAAVSIVVRRVPHHGPLIPAIDEAGVVAPSPEQGALSVRSVAADALRSLQPLLALARTSSIGQAQAALVGRDSGASGWVLADDSGYFLWAFSGAVPERDAGALAWDRTTYHGVLPCLLLPGTGGAEWVGLRHGDELPSWADRAHGPLALANEDPTGATYDNDPGNERAPEGPPGYLGCRFDPGLRAARAAELLAGLHRRLDPVEHFALQADVRTLAAELLVPQLLLALDNALDEAAHAGRHPQLAAAVAEPGFDVVAVTDARAALSQWGELAGYRAVAGTDPETGQPLALAEPDGSAARAAALFEVWLVRLLERTLGDELSLVAWPADRAELLPGLLYLATAVPASLATYDPLVRDSVLWDDLATPELRELRQDRFVRALLDAQAWLGAELGADPTAHRWGTVHRARLAALGPHGGGHAVPNDDDPTFAAGFPRGGDGSCLDGAPFSFGWPTEEGPSFALEQGAVARFVVDLAPGEPRGFGILAGGATEEATDSHFADEAELWRRNEIHEIPFSLADVLQVAESRVVAAPAL